MNNQQITVIPIEVRLISDLKTGTKDVQHDLEGMKTALMPFGFYYVCKLVPLFPFFVFDWLLNVWTRKVIGFFSNVPGPREAWSIAGYKCKSFAFMIPFGKRLTMGWAAISHADVMKVTVAADKASVQDIDWLKD